MGDGLTPMDRFPTEDVRLRRALSRLGIQTVEPSGLTLGFTGVAVKPQSPIFVDASGVGLNIDTDYLLISGTDLTFAAPIVADVTTTADIIIDSDTSCLYLGDGKDMSLCYGGADGVINTSLIAASDLVVTCGAQKTLELTTGVYKDINIGAATLSGPTGLQPDIENFLDNVGADTGIATLGVAINQAISGTFEIQHDYQEGTDLVFHVHWQGIADPSGNKYVKWSLAYSVMSNNATVPPVTPIIVETLFDTQYEHVMSQFAAIDGSAYKVGDQFIFTLTRVIAVGAAYLGDALLTTVGIHYQVDTLGSRQLLIK